MEELAVKNEFQTTQYIVIQLGDEKYGIDIQSKGWEDVRSKLNAKFLKK